MKSLSPQLMEDLIIEILIRVCYKTLLRCKCVCKRWQVLINDPVLMQRFITRSATLAPLTTGVFYAESSSNSEDSRRDFDSVDQKFSAFDSESLGDTSLGFLGRPVIVVASHNGFLLCAVNPNKGETNSKHDFQYVVCNPLTKQSVDVPKEGGKRRIKEHTVLYCYTREESDGQSAEFKVMCFPSWWLWDGKGAPVMTYSSETREWKESMVWRERVFYHTSNIVVLQGSVYFCCSWQQLCRFDLKKESVTLMKLPVQEDIYYNQLGVSSGCLYYTAEKSIGIIGLWILHDSGEWISKYDIIQQNFRAVGPCTFHPVNPHLLWFHSSHGKMYSYDATKRNIEMISHKHNDDTPVVPYCLPAWTPCLKN